MYLNFDSKTDTNKYADEGHLSNVVKTIRARLSCAEFEVISEDGFRI
jgi:hypothetical protein